MIKRLLQDNFIKILFGVLVGLYSGILFLAITGSGDTPLKDVEFLEVFLMNMLSLNAESIESWIILVSFTVLGVMIAYAFIVSSALRKMSIRLNSVVEVTGTKNKFISMVLHHIRTPLSGARWSLLEKLKGTESDKVDSKQLRFILLGVERALSAVDHLISAAQASTGLIQYNFEVTTIDSLLQHVKKAILFFVPAANTKKITHLTKFHTPSVHMIKIDVEKIIVVVQTLFENAIAYTLEGGSVSIETEERDNFFIFRISDTGIGIPKEDGKKISEQFYRSENAVRANAGGFGIGIFLAKTFIKKHEGTIEFVSEPNKGTTFTFKIPFIKTPTESYLEKI